MTLSAEYMLRNSRLRHLAATDQKAPEGLKVKVEPRPGAALQVGRLDASRVASGSATGGSRQPTAREWDLDSR